MGLEKTTTFAGLVWVAGLLALILFRDVFAGSGTGLILGLVLSVLMLVATYLIMDGVKGLIRSQQEREGLQQKAYEDKLYEFMQEQIHELLEFEKATYEAVKNLSFQEIPEGESIDSEILDQMAGTINDTTMRAAKLIVKYSNKTSTEMQKKLDTLSEEVSNLRKDS